jgi:hypothetical protein
MSQPRPRDRAHDIDDGESWRASLPRQHKVLAAVLLLGIIFPAPFVLHHIRKNQTRTHV